MALAAARSSSSSPQPMASAMVARPASSSQSNATDRSSIRSLDFSNGIDLTDKQFLYYDEDQGFEFFDKEGKQKQGTPFIFRAITGFSVAVIDSLSEESYYNSNGQPKFSKFLKAIGVYEYNNSLDVMQEKRLGQVFNFIN